MWMPKVVPLGSLGQLCWLHGSKACTWEGQNSDFEESCIVLTHFRVPNGVFLEVVQSVENLQAGPQGLARESYLAILASWLEAGLLM